MSKEKRTKKENYNTLPVLLEDCVFITLSSRGAVVKTTVVKLQDFFYISTIFQEKLLTLLFSRFNKIF